ncbi:MAG: ABC transporter ATP-binding protein [Planctomycetota bacterium]|nr:MAG: ABC transporter ATP-binding protein [Planctomycetota bacterium]
MCAAFALEAVEKRYGRSVALCGLSFRAERGESLALVGPNGAGKSTALKCLAGLVRPDAGRALLGGRDARSTEARRVLGYLPERPRYEERCSGEELLRREGRLHALERAARRRRARDLLERVGLPPEVAVRPVGTYSKGERARLGLALSLVGDPQVLLLDEPTDGLDLIGRRAVRTLLQELRADGRSLLLNSHSLVEVEACCERVIVLRSGREVAQGSPEALRARGPQRWLLRLTAPPAPQVRERICEGLELLETDGPVLRFAVEDPALVDGAIDRARSAGLGIRELRPEGGLEEALADILAGGFPA